MLNGIAVFVMLTMFFMWCGPKWRQRIAGFGLVTDISIHILCQLLLGGANEGRLAVLFGCVMFNLSLMTYRKMWGYVDHTGHHPGLFNFRKRHEQQS